MVPFGGVLSADANFIQVHAHFVAKNLAQNKVNLLFDQSFVIQEFYFFKEVIKLHDGQTILIRRAQKIKDFLQKGLIFLAQKRALI